MTDFTKKGTKLPVIPAGTKFKWLENETDFKEPSPSNINGFNSDNHDFISLGKFKHKKQTYVICDSEDIGHSSLRYLIKLSTIERLAKEQGMCDDGITMTFKQYEPFRVLELHPDLKVTFPCGHEITIQTSQFLNTTDCEQCKEKEVLEIGTKIIREALQSSQSLLKSQQMKTQVELKDNGEIVLSPKPQMEYIIDKATVDEICRLVKEDKAKLEIRKWYREVCIDGSENKALFYVTEIKGNIFYAYGFNYSGNWRNNWRSNCYFGITNPSDTRYEIASPETVEQYLREEAVKRGFNGKLKFKPIGSHLEVIRDGNENTFGFNESSNQLLYCNYVIFRDGQWATIINPETITKAEAEKELGKVITD